MSGDLNFGIGSFIANFFYKGLAQKDVVLLPIILFFLTEYGKLRIIYAISKHLINRASSSQKLNSEIQCAAIVSYFAFLDVTLAVLCNNILIAINFLFLIPALIVIALDTLMFIKSCAIRISRNTVKQQQNL